MENQEEKTPMENLETAYKNLRTYTREYYNAKAKELSASHKMDRAYWSDIMDGKIVGKNENERSASFYSNHPMLMQGTMSAKEDEAWARAQFEIAMLDYRYWRFVASVEGENVEDYDEV